MEETMKDGIVPSVGVCFPEFMETARTVVESYQGGVLTSWQALTDSVRSQLTPHYIQYMDTRLPGWKRMTAYADGQTWFHIVCAFVGLLTLPEYQSASKVDRCLYEWGVLLHDIAKRAQKEKRDSAHGFRSAACAARILPLVGFQTRRAFAAIIEDWIALVDQAYQVVGNDYVQDNCYLPEIVVGIDQMFGKDTPTAWILKGILFHVSLNQVKEWPSPAALTEVEMQMYFDTQMLPFLKVITLVDSDAWSLFDPGIKDSYRQETLSYFGSIEHLFVN